MELNKTLTAGGNKRGNNPLVELINRLEIHRTLSLHNILDGVQTRIRNHLNNVSVLSPSHTHSATSARVMLRRARCTR